MEFYVLLSPRQTNGPAVTDFTEADPCHLGEAPRCPKCGNFIGSRPWLPPHRAELEVWGKQYGDIAFSAGGGQMIVSDRFKDLYVAEGLVDLGGFEIVKIVDVVRRGSSTLRPPSPLYYHVAIPISKAAIDPAASQAVYEEPVTCDECRIGSIKRWSKIIVEGNAWSGEDIFYARGLPGTIVTSERFKAFFQRNRINNGLLLNAKVYSHDFYPWESKGGESSGQNDEPK